MTIYETELEKKLVAQGLWQPLADTIANAVNTGGAGGSLPNGGTTGQTLIKNSSTDGDASWSSDITTALESKIAETQRDQPNGFPGLDANGDLVGSLIPRQISMQDMSTVIGSDGEIATITGSRSFAKYENNKWNIITSSGDDVISQKSLSNISYKKLRTSTYNAFSRNCYHGTQYEVNDLGSQIIDQRYNENFTVSVSATSVFVTFDQVNYVRLPNLPATPTRIAVIGGYILATNATSTMYCMSVITDGATPANVGFPYSNQWTTITLPTEFSGLTNLAAIGVVSKDIIDQSFQSTAPVFFICSTTHVVTYTPYDGTFSSVLSSDSSDFDPLSLIVYPYNNSDILYIPSSLSNGKFYYVNNIGYYSPILHSTTIPQITEPLNGNNIAISKNKFIVSSTSQSVAYSTDINEYGEFIDPTVWDFIGNYNLTDNSNASVPLIYTHANKDCVIFIGGASAELGAVFKDLNSGEEKTLRLNNIGSPSSNLIVVSLIDGFLIVTNKFATSGSISVDFVSNNGNHFVLGSLYMANLQARSSSYSNKFKIYRGDIFAHGQGYLSFLGVATPKESKNILKSAELATLQITHNYTILTDTSAKAAFTLILPKMPINSEKFVVSFRSTITTLTISPGQTFQTIETGPAGGNYTISNITNMGRIEFVYDFNASNWRIL